MWLQNTSHLTESQIRVFYIFIIISYPGLSGLSFLNGDGVSTSGSRNCGERGSDESEISERGFRAEFMIKFKII